MNIEEKVISIITGDPTCSGIIEDRLYPIFADDESLELDDPYAVYLIYSNNRDYTFDGDVDAVARIQVSCFADTYEKARSLKVAVILAFETAQVTDKSIAIYDTDEANFYEKDTKLYHCVADMRIWFNE